MPRLRARVGAMSDELWSDPTQYRVADLPRTISVVLLPIHGLLIVEATVERKRDGKPWFPTLEVEHYAAEKTAEAYLGWLKMCSRWEKASNAEIEAELEDL